LSDIFREVDEDLRRQRAEELWKTYGSYAAAAVVAVVAVVAGVSWWNSARQSASEEAASAFVAASKIAESGEDPAAAADAFAAIAKDASGGYGTVAAMRAASLQAESGDIEGAVAAFDAIAAGSGDKTLRGLAGIKAALLLSDTASPDELEVRLTPLAAEGSAWRYSALELMGYAALRAEDHEKAALHYQTLADAPLAPPLARERARNMLRGLQLEGPVARQLPTEPEASPEVAGQEPTPQSETLETVTEGEAAQ